MLISTMWYVSDHCRVHVAHTCIECGQYMYWVWSVHVMSLNTASTSRQMSVCSSFMTTGSHRTFLVIVVT